MSSGGSPKNTQEASTVPTKTKEEVEALKEQKQKLREVSSTSSILTSGTGVLGPDALKKNILG